MKQHLRLLPFEVTSERTNKGRTAMYEEIAEGKFPRPVKTGKRGVAWVESEIDAWIERLIAVRDAADSGVHDGVAATQYVPNVPSPMSKLLSPPTDSARLLDRKTANTSSSRPTSNYQSAQPRAVLKAFNAPVASRQNTFKGPSE